MTKSLREAACIRPTVPHVLFRGLSSTLKYQLRATAQVMTTAFHARMDITFLKDKRQIQKKETPQKKSRS